MCPTMPLPAAEVTLVVESAKTDGARGNTAALLSLIAQWDAERYRGSGRSKEKIDADLNALRDEWDRD